MNILAPRARRIRERFMVASFTIEREQHEWLQREAMRLTNATQTRVGMSDIIRAVIAAMMEKQHVHPDAE